ncbi:AAA family ATPase [Deinococcus aquiradiocola]|uniref:ORC1/DEAH AAA+ ATPase domain-containing protein n=1 Tax=Deinococcus aquiradiocola TaxID=393059 RepID=A0A917PD70_9DEIO|nr:AAA family ATPase [Deinococcus aquiradiocola]GGJ71283.1 hypothetical protein GCM10008939_14570 [Deinococcus aquiradiocola]
MSELKAFNRSRHLYHATCPPIATPDLQDFHSQMLLQIERNLDGDDGACPGGLLDGLGTLGKTTILKHLGKRFEQQFIENYPAEDAEQQDLVIPVAIVTMTSGASPKDLSLSLARYYDLVLPDNTKSITRTDITAAVIRAAHLHQTKLILVDEAHFIDMRTDAGQLANNHFKQLMNDTGATFVFAGIDCKGSGLLTEGLNNPRKSQIGGRLMYRAITPMTLDSEAWTGVLTDIEKLLVLGNLPAGTLHVGLRDYLYARTGGSIGSLMNLIRKAARVAVDSETETITETMLSNIALDHNAEMGREARTPNVSRNRTTSGRKATSEETTGGAKS